mmetsp:Transcript_15774/g.61546  ORF Transcript_15774/g.61546 Transcript_15774/m.61546 type:complete len:347 (+) Transcript_15774:223-1263(+)
MTARISQVVFLAPTLRRLFLDVKVVSLRPASRRHACRLKNHLLHLVEKLVVVQDGVPPARHDAVVSLERWPVVRAVALAGDEHTQVLQLHHNLRQLRLLHVRPRVELLGQHDHAAEHAHERARVGCEARGEQQGYGDAHRRRAGGVNVVGELALGDGPRVLVVALEGVDDAAHHRRRLAPVIVHGPVEHAGAQVGDPVRQEAGADEGRPRRGVAAVASHLDADATPRHQSRARREQAGRDGALEVGRDKRGGILNHGTAHGVDSLAKGLGGINLHHAAAHLNVGVDAAAHVHAAGHVLNHPAHGRVSRGYLNRRLFGDRAPAGRPRGARGGRRDGPAEHDGDSGHV